jgi:pimeloyl-ACP methyl ester carboxylesterase
MPHFPTPDGVRLFYEDSGAGTPIVFVHEFAGDYRSYEPQVRYFSRRYRCLTYNARGYPPSDVPPDPAAYSQVNACNDCWHCWIICTSIRPTWWAYRWVPSRPCT